MCFLQIKDYYISRLEACIATNQEEEAISENYGIDVGGPLPDEDIGTVVIPETVSPFDEDEISEFMVFANRYSRMSSLNDIDSIVAHYVSCKSYLNYLLSNQH